MKIVLIEDETLTARDLQRTLLATDPDLDITAILTSVEQAIDYLKTKPEIDLIFSDIQLGDGLSFEIFEKTHNQIPVVFCTAYHEYALKAFETAGIDYILKPFNKESIAKALHKYQSLKQKLAPPPDNFHAILQLLKNQLSQKQQSVIIYQADKIIPLDTRHIALFYAEDHYTFAFSFDEKKYLVSQTLENLEANFAPAFFRASRRFLLNRTAVRDASHTFNRKLTVNLSVQFPEPVLIGKLKTTAFLEWLTAL